MVANKFAEMPMQQFIFPSVLHWVTLPTSPNFILRDSLARIAFWASTEEVQVNIQYTYVEESPISLNKKSDA